MLILSRSGQGVGGAIMFATSLALLGHSFRGRDRGVAFGVWGAVIGVSTALGPVLGGVITTDWSWRGIFLVNVPIGVLAVALTAWRVEESKSPHPTPPDWAGFALLTTGPGQPDLRAHPGRARSPGRTPASSSACDRGRGAGRVHRGRAARRAPHVRPVAAARADVRRGSIAAFAMNGSLYAVLLWLVIYLQDVLGYSAQDAGLRLAIISGAQLVTAVVAGRVSERVPARWLIGPGLLLVGVGLIIMGGLTGTSDWTHLIPGFIVAGLGGGLVNPPLASTAIGVVPPEKAGMASGVNSTFRQIGIAAGIAALGSIFNSALQHNLASAPAVASSAPRIATMVRQGQVGQLLASLPPARRGVVAEAIRSAFAAGLNDLLIVTAALAFAGAVCALLLIRPQGLRAHRPHAAAGRLARGRGLGPARTARARPVRLSIKAGPASAGRPDPGRVGGGPLGLGAEGLHGPRRDRRSRRRPSRPRTRRRPPPRSARWSPR